MVNPSQNDIIRDVIHRLQDALDKDRLRVLESDLRRQWGGVPNVPHKRGDRVERNSRIHRAYLSGVRLTEIARTEKVTERRILQIIKS